jgi:CBS domain-containing protein
MQVREIMSQDVTIITPDDTLQRAAKLMADIDAGVLPVGENDRLVGMLTDRDITVRAVAQGKAPDQCRVRDVMSSEIKFVFEDDSVDDAARKMSELQVRRLPVLNPDKRLVGIVSLGDIAAKQGGKPAEQAVSGVSQPSGGKSA